MSSWTYGARANEMSHFSTTRTLSDFPLLIGEMLTSWQPPLSAAG